MVFLVNVTQDHIDTGFRGRCRTCPIARAIQDVPKIASVSFCEVLENYDAHYIQTKRFENIILPKAVSAKINLYDRGYDMEPFSFVLEIPNAFFN
jgi:hypothetical protein